MRATITRRLPTTVQLPGEGVLHVAAQLWLPDALRAPATVLVCLPGGAMRRSYFDLMAGEDESFSFARQMARRGYLVIAIDHLGVGESDRPADSYALTHERLMQANAEATESLLTELRAGRCVPELPALPALRSIGVGHSMGSMMTILQQAAHRQHAAVALLGFSTRGLPEYVSPAVRELAKDVAAVRAEVPRLAREMFVTDYPSIRATQDAKVIYASGNAEAAGVMALKPAIEKLLPVTAYLSMVPGNVAPEAAQIDVPVFLGLGENDMAGPPHQVPTAFTASQEVLLHILPQTGHNHFVFATRRQLFERLDAWCRAVLAHLE